MVLGSRAMHVLPTFLIAILFGVAFFLVAGQMHIVTISTETQNHAVGEMVRFRVDSYGLRNCWCDYDGLSMIERWDGAWRIIKTSPYGCVDGIYHRAPMDVNMDCTFCEWFHSAKELRWNGVYYEPTGNTTECQFYTGDSKALPYPEEAYVNRTEPGRYRASFRGRSVEFVIG